MCGRSLVLRSANFSPLALILQKRQGNLPSPALSPLLQLLFFALAATPARPIYQMLTVSISSYSRPYSPSCSSRMEAVRLSEP